MSLMAGWERAEFHPGGADAFLSYVVFGVVPETLSLPRVAADVPNLSIRRFTAADNGETLRAFLEGPDMQRLERDSPELAELARGVSECALVSATVPDPPDLLYLRRIRHVVAALVDAGGCVLLDGPTLTWWKPALWRSNILAPAELSIEAEVVLRVTGDESLWVRTRGLRKFGRPDISIRGVPAGDRQTAVAYCREWIAGLVAGRPAPEQSGDLNDPEFNNYHLPVIWPVDGR
jgi:hypothetical protein